MSFDNDFQQPSDVREAGLKVGRLMGVEVRLHWLLLFLFALLLLEGYVRPHGLPSPLLAWLVSVGAILVAGCLRELTRAYVAFRQGETVERVTLWPLGGFTQVRGAPDPRRQCWQAIAGPFADLMKAGFAVAVCLACGWPLLPVEAGAEAAGPYWVGRLFVQYSLLWNVFLLTLNLLPCLPLDGGQVLQCWRSLASGNRAQGTVEALRVSRITAFLALGTGIFLFLLVLTNGDFAAEHPFLHLYSFGLTLLALMHFSVARTVEQEAAYGEEESGLFGYDFSLGYTSLERTATRKTRPSLSGLFGEELRRRRRQRQALAEEILEEELDRVLEKIYRAGMGSLKRRERRFLRRASLKFRQRQ